MNTRSSSWTQKTPRSMSAAFGPYTDNNIAEAKADYCAAWWAGLILCGLFTLIYIGSTL